MTLRVLLCGTDPGGAANLGPLVPALKAGGAMVSVITAPNLAGRFRGDGIEMNADVTPDSTAALVDRYQPDAVIVGTTRYDSPDRRLLRIAADRGIRSVAVLDERYLYRARFDDDWPDVITLIDEASREEAIAEGLPPERLHVTGSPALAELVATIDELEKAPPPKPGSLGDEAVITFVSETLSADYGRSPEAPGPMGDFVGYTEETVLRELVEVAGSLGRALVVIDKRHPADEGALQPGAQVGKVRVATVRDEPLWPLLWHSQAVVGMRSMALLEAAVMGVPTLSFQPGLIGGERCTAVRLGLVPQTTSPSDAAQWLATVLDSTASARHRPSSETFAPRDAAHRVVALALKGIS